MSDKLILGSLEVCDLPDIGVADLQMRVDTGAKTSSIHVDNISQFKKNGKLWVKFDIHPDFYNVNSVTQCQSLIHDVRTVKSSNGESQERYVIKTLLKLGRLSWPIEITLTDRSDMSNLMLLGREGMGDKILVDPAQSFLISDESTEDT
jgi:hypothetical protein